MIKRNLPLMITIGVFVLGYLYCLTQFPGFASTRVICNILTDNAFLGIIAVGMTFVILSGGIDLSVGSVIAFTGVFLAKVIGDFGLSPLLAFPLVLVMGCAVVLYSDKEERGTYLAILTGIVLLDALIWGIKGLLKRRGGSAELNRGITLVSVLILSFIFSFTYLRSVRNGQFDQTPENATRYEVTWSNGETSFYYAYDDPLPLYVQDLTKTDYDRYSCELAEESSPLASQVRGAQRMRTGDEDDAPELNYEVTDVKFAPLFDACLDGELKYFQNYTVTFYRTHRPFRNWEYREVDTAPWGAERAWRLYDEEEEQWLDHWLITGGTRIVEFISSDLEMTDARMAIVGEKLLSADLK